MVTVVVINWNSGELLYKCLKNLSMQTVVPDRIIVFDNSSDDSSLDVCSEFISVEVQKSNENIGFAKANNLVLSQVRTEFIALLNPDAFPEPTWLEELLLAAHTHADVPSFSSRQMKYNKEGVVDGLGDEYHFSGLAWRRSCRQTLRDSDLLSREVFSACAAAALYRTKILKVIGGFDEDFFCYLEDVDLGFRLRLAGYKAMYVPAAVVQHVGSATTGGKGSDISSYYGNRNILWVYMKNMPSLLFWLFLPIHLAMNFSVLTLFFIRGRGKLMWRAKLDALKGFPMTLKKRSEIQKNRKASVIRIWRSLNKSLFPVKRKP